MIQKYFEQDILMHLENKTLTKVVGVVKDLDPTPYYSYEIETDGVKRHGMVSQHVLDNKYITKKEIDIQIRMYEKDREKADSCIAELKWIRAEYLNKVKQLDKDSKR